MAHARDATEPPRDAGRAPVLAGALAGSVLALTIALIGGGGSVEDWGYGDGLIARYVAGHLDQPPGEVSEVLVERGVSLRYGRVGLPLLTWALAGGRDSLMAWGHLAAIALAAGAAAAASIALFPRAGPLAFMLPFLAPGLTLSIDGGYAEVLALGAGLWALVLALDDRWWACAAVLAIAILARENAVAIGAGLAGVAVLRGRARALIPLTLSVVPTLAWYAVVRARYGSLPPLDPYLREVTDTVDTPFVAVLRSLLDATSGGAAAMVLVHLGLLATAFLLFRRSAFAWLAIVAGMQLVAAGPFAWRFIGDAARVNAFLQLWLILALVALWRPGWRSPSLARLDAEIGAAGRLRRTDASTEVEA